MRRRETVFYGLVQRNVLITGANGQLGSELRKLSETTDTAFRFLFTDADTLDITDARHVKNFVKDHSVEYIVNCAAYTAVDKAETDVDTAFGINHVGARNLAESGAKIIHISTDYVFDGNADMPYKEDVPANPQSVYGKSKLQGEEAIRSLAQDWVIIRTAWLYSEFGNNFVKTMIRLMNERDEISVVADQRGTPTYAADLAEMILVILETDEWKTGVYHFSNLGETTWYDFAKKIKTLSGNTRTRITPISTGQYKTAATRPAYSVLDKSKIQSAFRVLIPDWENGLERCIRKLKL